jgi:acetoin utilization deacetylase AcuC-like enzyme/GNAT superfamily N-acetyltransferase
VPPLPRHPVSLTIGRHIAGLIPDGSTMHFDRSVISAATMRYLTTRHDLGIHTDIITDDILRLIETGAVTNRLKTVHRGKTVATLAMGSSYLYTALSGNPYVELLPIDDITDPNAIGLNDNMISVQAIDEVELTGMARSDTERTTLKSSLPTTMDFVHGARRARNGFVILALSSTTPDGARSRIVADSIGRGVAFNRAVVDYVVTEYGTVDLRGLTVRERAIALISIAHPRFRHELLEQAKEYNFVDADQVVPPETGCVYPRQYEFTKTFADGTAVRFRPLQPSDARRLQRLFYALSPETVRLRYHGTVKALSNAQAQKQAAVDFSRDMAIVGLVGPARNPEIIGEGRYALDPDDNMGEFDIVVREDFRGHGIGTFLANYLGKIAYARGLSGVYADVIPENRGTMALLKRAWPTAERTHNATTCTFTVRFPAEDVERPKDSIIVYSGRYSDYSYGDEHPFNPSRATETLRLIDQQGYLNEPWMRVEEPRMVTKERLAESHAPGYMDALEEANSGVWSEELVKYNLGTDDCPVFPGLFDYVLLYSSATLTGVDLITEENANVVFNPLGGFHHASRAHAEGFCYVNDIVAAIDTFLARDYRVACVDIDAHHGNGVQDAFYNDDRVLTVSLHQSGKTLYPWSGFGSEIGQDIGEGFNINIPLPEQTDDESFLRVFDNVVVPAVEMFAPSVVIAVVGADTHRNDPLANLSMTNNGMEEAMERLRKFGRHLLILGGGGYDLACTTRAWCRVWAAANHIDALPDYMVVMGGTFLGGEGVQGAEVVDMNYRVTGAKKSVIKQELSRLIAWHRKETFPRMESALAERAS